jgi:hypothetical protein
VYIVFPLFFLVSMIIQKKLKCFQFLINCDLEWLSQQKNKKKEEIIIIIIFLWLVCEILQQLFSLVHQPCIFISRWYLVVCLELFNNDNIKNVLICFICRPVILSITAIKWYEIIKLYTVYIFFVLSWQQLQQ